VISELIAAVPNREVLDFVNHLENSDIYLSVITIGEIKFGIENVQSSTKKEQLFNWLHDDLLVKFEGKIVDINIEVMLAWGALSHKSKKSGKPLPLMDSLIAATCAAFDFTLITRNEKDFQNLNIQIMNPYK
jgi:predicted nucleic acid-binding protein